MAPRRKKWTEAEEKTLIDKYGGMISDGTLAKMKTREKKFKPISHHVNSMHHLRDPVGFPWLWTWKDVSTKVQNMRHQYLLVKQKVKRPEDSIGDSNVDEFDWIEGLTHWSNFLRYKEVFGDVPISSYNNITNGEGIVTGADIVEFEQFVQTGDFVGIDDGGENGVLSLELEYNGEEAEENFNGNGNTRQNQHDFLFEDVDPVKKKRKSLKGLEKRNFRFLLNQLAQFKDMEARFEQREVERERERRRRENARIENEVERQKEKEDRENEKEKLRIQRVQQWEALERESEERERRRVEEALKVEKEWEERMFRKRLEWKKRIENMLIEHRAEVGEMQNRMLHEQQNLTNQFIGIVSQWTANPSGISDHSGASNHYLSQMIQNLHHVSVDGEERVDGDNQDDQFIVDG